MILEFHGCWYHGCPTCFPNRSDINVRTKTSYKELLDKTNKRKHLFIELGYIVIEIWECEWNRIKKHNLLLDEHVSYVKNQLV
jgi:G:T-mismatch repair DNA endonuclease (very short patch repair protein)